MARYTDRNGARVFDIRTGDQISCAASFLDGIYGPDFHYTATYLHVESAVHNATEYGCADLELSNNRSEVTIVTVPGSTLLQEIV